MCCDELFFEENSFGVGYTHFVIVAEFSNSQKSHLTTGTKICWIKIMFLRCIGELNIEITADPLLLSENAVTDLNHHTRNVDRTEYIHKRTQKHLKRTEITHRMKMRSVSFDQHII
jgi:hypothetical protein